MCRTENEDWDDEYWIEEGDWYEEDNDKSFHYDDDTLPF